MKKNTICLCYNAYLFMLKKAFPHSEDTQHKNSSNGCNLRTENTLSCVTPILIRKLNQN